MIDIAMQDRYQRSKLLNKGLVYMEQFNLILEKLTHMDEKIDRNYNENKEEQGKILNQVLKTNGKVNKHSLILWISGAFLAGLGLINIKTIISFLLQHSF